MIWFWTATLILDFAHSVSPMALVCSHRGLREIAFQRWLRCIALPVGVFAVAALAGAATVLGLTSYDLHLVHQARRITGITNPLPLVLWTNFYWNIYHYSMQNFGLVRLLGLPGPRWLHRVVISGGTATVMLIALPWPLNFIVGAVLISWGHLFTELWLTWRVSGWRPLFIIAVLALGCLALIWDVPTSHGLSFHASGVLLVLFMCRIGCSFAHFLTDAWIWKMSDPEVRAVIGPRLGLAST